MAEYRAYAVGIDGHFVSFEALVCVDDVEAIDKAKRLIDGACFNPSRPNLNCSRGLFSKVSKFDQRSLT
jgi:hypothetical protein